MSFHSRVAVLRLVCIFVAIFRPVPATAVHDASPLLLAQLCRLKFSEFIQTNGQCVPCETEEELLTTNCCFNNDAVLRACLESSLAAGDSDQENIILPENEDAIQELVLSRGKRSEMAPLVKRTRNTFLGKRSENSRVKRARNNFLGKRDPTQEEELLKRARNTFLGKRWFDIERRSRNSFLGKRGFSMPGPGEKRSRNSFLGKRQPETTAEMEKRARNNFLGKRQLNEFSKKSRVNFLGKREGLEKRARNTFLGKRVISVVPPSSNNNDGEQLFSDHSASGLDAEKRQRNNFLGKRARNTFLG